MPWSLIHFFTVVPCFITYMLFAWWLGLRLKNKREEIRLIPIHIITITLVVLEIIKQILAIQQGYTTDKLPFYFCSFFFVT